MVEEEDDKLEVGLSTVQSIFSSGKISDNEHDKLKEMLFAEDGVLFSLLSSYDPGSPDLEDAIIKYVKGSEEDSLKDATSPLDSGLDFKKKKKTHQQAAAENPPAASAMAIGECEIGASPIMTKGLQKRSAGKHSPLQKTRELAFK